MQRSGADAGAENVRRLEAYLEGLGNVPINGFIWAA